MRAPSELTNRSGQALPLFVIVVVIGAFAVLGLGRMAVHATDRAQAQSAADAAALAGAAEGRRGAEKLAAANGATLVRFERSGPEIEVRVRVGSAHATARARIAGRWRAGGVSVS